MAEVEHKLHTVFKNSNVKLVKSREWFNLNPLQVQQCIWLMNRYQQSHASALPMKAIAGSLIALLSVGMLIGQSFQPESINQVKIEKSVKRSK